MIKMEINKVIREGKVAILVTRMRGAGWYSTNGVEEMLFDPIIVNMLEEKIGSAAIRNYCIEKYKDAYLGGIENLRVYWIPVGTEFQIEGCDGVECIRYRNGRVEWIVA